MTCCHHPKRCLKETSPGNGIFFGNNPFVYDENYLGCYHCKRILEEKEKGENNECDGESISGEI